MDKHLHIIYLLFTFTNDMDIILALEGLAQMLTFKNDPQIWFLRLQNAIAREMFRHPYSMLSAKRRIKADKAFSKLLMRLGSIIPEFFEYSRQDIGFKPDTRRIKNKSLDEETHRLSKHPAPDEEGTEIVIGKCRKNSTPR
jgi:hypothetical protein